SGTFGNGGASNGGATLRGSGGAGGGGWFGGGGGGSVDNGSGSAGGGGGGSSFAAPGAANVTMETGVNGEDGSVVITAADPGVGCPVLAVKKTVSGTSTAGFVVQVTCTQGTATTVDHVDLRFTKDGVPDTTATPSGWVVNDGTWQLTQPSLTN